MVAGERLEDCGAAATRLRRSAVDVEVSMSTRLPLTQNPRRRMQNVHEMSVGWIQVTRIVGPGVDEDRWIQPGDSSDFSLTRFQVIRNQAAHVCANRITNEVHVVGRNTARMTRDVFD